MNAGKHVVANWRKTAAKVRRPEQLPWVHRISCYGPIVGILLIHAVHMVQVHASAAPRLKVPASLKVSGACTAFIHIPSLLCVN